MIDVITIFGFGTVISGLIYIGRKLQTLEELKNTSDKIKENMEVIGDLLTRDNTGYPKTSNFAKFGILKV